MGTWRSWRVTAATLAMVFGVAVLARAEAERPAVVLHVQNWAEVSQGDLARAKAEVDNIFADAGVDVAWAEGAPPKDGVEQNAVRRPRRISVMLLNITRDSQAGAEGCALGLAVASRSAAYVFFNRLLAATRNRPVDLPVVLGRAVAHEVGHVLLPPGRHSKHGLMRAELDFTLTRPARFTREEVEALQRGLAPAITERLIAGSKDPALRITK
jgi:hypothetical protein